MRTTKGTKGTAAGASALRQLDRPLRSPMSRHARSTPVNVFQRMLAAIAAVVAVIAVAAIGAQQATQQATQPPGQQPVFRSGTKLVVETVTVKDKNGKV